MVPNHQADNPIINPIINQYQPLLTIIKWIIPLNIGGYPLVN